MDIKIYIRDIKNCLLLNNSNTSKEKAEKVVKDPKSPIIKKYLKKISLTNLF